MAFDIETTRALMHQIGHAIDTELSTIVFVVGDITTNEPDNPESMVMLDVSSPDGVVMYELQLVPKVL